MLFHTIEYFVLLSASVVLYFLLPHRARWIILLFASYWFYGTWRIEYLGLLLISTAIDYSCGLALGHVADNIRRRLILGLSLSVNLSILGYFKYRLLFGEALGALAPSTDIHNWMSADFILPIGISFYTLQTMGYTIDVFRRTRLPERHPGYFALYVAFFPQLIAGPIERSTRLLPQLRTLHSFQPVALREGCQLLLLGLFKKVVVVGFLGSYLVTVYSNPENASSVMMLLAVYLSGVYIYLDFSAYIDMARGSARIFGIRLSKNFNHPLGAITVRDYWKRWHISLTSWIFDYLHQPLSRLSKRVVMQLLFILFTFTIVGLWHGPAWNFVLFGLYNGCLVLVEIQTERMGLSWAPGRLWNIFRIARTQFLLCFGAILFMSPDLMTAGLVIHNLTHWTGTPEEFINSDELTPLWLTAIAVMFLSYLHRLEAGNEFARKFDQLPAVVRWTAYYAAMLLLIINSDQGAEAFVYYQF